MAEAKRGFGLTCCITGLMSLNRPCRKTIRPNPGRRRGSHAHKCMNAAAKPQRKVKKCSACADKGGRSQGRGGMMRRGTRHVRGVGLVGPPSFGSVTLDLIRRRSCQDCLTAAAMLLKPQTLQSLIALPGGSASNTMKQGLCARPGARERFGPILLRRLPVHVRRLLRRMNNPFPTPPPLFSSLDPIESNQIESIITYHHHMMYPNRFFPGGAAPAAAAAASIMSGSNAPLDAYFDSIL
jgi:hypothetical protein